MRLIHNSGLAEKILTGKELLFLRVYSISILSKIFSEWFVLVQDVKVTLDVEVE